jgi:putative tryptophan/tyrosine transport system ATP-binding protein
MIRLESVKVVYNRGTTSEIKALDLPILELASGSFTMVVGSNGSGKSSLLNLLAGNLHPAQGRVFFHNKDITMVPDHVRSTFIARIFQDPLKGTAPEMSLLENFRLAALRDKTKSLHTGLNHAFKQKVADQVARLQMDLESRLDQPMGTFSGGQRQALSLLMATWCRADLLLMDEPTAALDPASASLVFNLAQSIIREKGITCLMVTHDLKYCLQAGDRIIQFSEGQVLKDLGEEEKSLLSLTDLVNWFA